METLDCRAHKCPHPVVETRKQLLARPDAGLRVLVGDEIARDNVTRMAASLGYQVLVNSTEGGFSLDLAPGQAVEAKAASPAQGKTVAFIAAETMGHGDDELGRILLRNFLITLTEMDQAPDTLLFVNGGVKLTAQGSEALEALDKLACAGADIASCGLCLEFFNLKDKLAVGRVTNMLDIAETLQQAGRVIRP